MVELSAPKAKAKFIGNLVSDGGHRQNNQVLVNARNGALLEDVTGSHNWLSGGFGGVGRTRLDPTKNMFRWVDFSLFVSPTEHDYHLTPRAIGVATTCLSADAIELPEVLGMTKAESEMPLAWQYRHPAAKERRPLEKKLTLGAYARSPASRP